MDDRIKRLEPFWGVWYIKRLIGQGAFGTVYEIERREYGTVYTAALKVISIPQTQNEYKDALAEGMSGNEATTYFRSMVEEMTKEFALMDSVKGHTNIVDYSDHQVIERQDCFGWDILIRMELLTPLNDHLARQMISENEVIRLGMDICRALEVCEYNNIIHRDIKPGNIFISKRGEYKLGDFGVARVSERTKDLSTRIGTKSYLAPEVYRGQKYDKTVDIYALGIVMYQLLNKGKLPFFQPQQEIVSVSDKEEAFNRRIQGKEELPYLECEHKALYEIIRKACAFDPADRFQSAGLMLKELERVSRGEIPVIVPVDNNGNNVPIIQTNENKIQSSYINNNNPANTQPHKKTGVIVGLIAGVLVLATALSLGLYFGLNADKPDTVESGTKNETRKNRDPEPEKKPTETAFADPDKKPGEPEITNGIDREAEPTAEPTATPGPTSIPEPTVTPTAMIDPGDNENRDTDNAWLDRYGEPVFSEEDRRQAEAAIDFIDFYGDYLSGWDENWHIDELFGFEDEYIQNEDISLSRLIKGNPTFEEIKTKFSDKAGKYMTDAFIGRILQSFENRFAEIDGKRYYITYFNLGEPGRGNYRFYTERGQYLAQYNGGTGDPKPWWKAYFIRQDGRLLLDGIVTDTGTWESISDHIIEINASSTLVERSVTHYPKRVVDGDIATAWSEGASGTGIGESISFKMDRACKITGMELWNGYRKSEEAYKKNSRPSKIEVIFGDGTSRIIQLDDRVNSEYFSAATGEVIYFDEPVYTDELTIVIRDVYKGEKYEDTLISELFLF